MADVRAELSRFGVRIVQAGLVAGAGGNISARDGAHIYMKPSGLALDEVGPDDWCVLELDSGCQVGGPHKPTSEVHMHLGCYRARPDIRAVFHTHSPWASGVISSGATLKPMFAEFVCDLGRTATVPYITPTTQALADAVARAVVNADTLFMTNHGILALGVTLKQAFYRCVVVEDAAKSQIAATITGSPIFLTEAQCRELMALDAPRHRIRMMQESQPASGE
jgi:L-fuculose-phosphate aldolase